MVTYGDLDDTLRPPWDPDRPYDDLPTLSRPGVELESRAVLKQLVPARVALAELKRSLELIPDPTMLLNTLPVLEAQASSEIEQIVTTSDELFRHLEFDGDGAPDPETKEALRYRRALLEGLQSLEQKPLSTRTAEEICTRIRGVEMEVRRVPGTALTDPATGETVYTPPGGEARIRDLLADWERFLHGPRARPGREEGDDSIDPLVRMAAAHYQFEAIHPFTDGNGRTGRILNILFLVEQGLLPQPVLYMSRYIIARKREYYDRLLAVTRDGAWEEWVLFMLEAVEDTSRWTTEKVTAIRRLADHTAEYVRERLPRIYSRELVDVIFERPYARIANVVDADIVERQAASRYLKALAGIGVLRVEKSGREKLFVHPRLLDLLTSESHEFSRYG